MAINSCPFQIGSTEDVLDWIREAKINALPFVDNKSLCRPATIYLEIAKEITRIDERLLVKPQEGVVYGVDSDLSNQADLYSVYVQLCNTAAVLARVFDAAMCPGFTVTDLTKTFGEKQNLRVRRFLSAELNLLSYFRMRLHSEIAKVKEEKEGKSTRDNLLRSQIVAMKRELTNKQAERNQLQLAVKQHEALRDDLVKREAEYDRQAESLSEQLTKTQAAIEAEKRRREELMTQRASVKRTIESYESMIVRSPERVRREIDSLREAIKTQMSLKKDAVRHCSDRTNERDELAKHTKRYEEAIAKVNRFRELSIRFAAAQRDGESASENIRELETQKRAAIDRLSNATSTLETRSDMMQRIEAAELTDREECEARRVELDSRTRSLRAAISEIDASFADWKTELEGFITRQADADRRDVEFIRKLLAEVSARVDADRQAVESWLRKLDENRNL